MCPLTTEGSPAFGRHERNVRRVLREVAQVLGHLRRTGRAVHPDDIGPHRFERGDGRADLGADEHAAGRLDRHLHHDRDERAGRGHGPAGAVDRGLGLQQVVDRLDEQHVDAAREQADDLRFVVVPEDLVADVAERRQLGAGPDRADHVPGLVRGRAVGRDLLGDLGGAAVDLERGIGDLVLVQHERERAERRGLDRIHAGFEVLRVHLGDEVRPGEHQVLVAAFERESAEVVGAEILALHPGTERTVEDEDALAQRVEER